MIFKAKNVVKKFKDSIILDSINLSIEKSQIICVQGASGSGKTTLLNVLGLLDKSSSGSIEYYNSLRYSSFNSLERVNVIGYIFQFHHLLSEFKVIDNLVIPQLLAGKKYSESVEYSKELLAALNLSFLLNRYSHEMSGGECQRIAVLRGVINKPDVVFADEPTGNLDSENSLNIIKLLNDLREDFNISFVIATHDNQVTKISDKLYYIKNGKLNRQ